MVLVPKVVVVPEVAAEVGLAVQNKGTKIVGAFFSSVFTLLQTTSEVVVPEILTPLLHLKIKGGKWSIQSKLKVHHLLMGITKLYD